MRIALLLLALCAPAQALDLSRRTGIGMGLGDPTGASLKHFLDKNSAVDLGLGVSGTLTLWADYSLHTWTLFPQPKRGALAGYLSVGPRWEDADPNDFGIRTMLGVSYWPTLKRHSVEVFLELGPTFRTRPKPARVRPEGTFGARWYFSTSKKTAK
jgi:hypothetical protein